MSPRAPARFVFARHAPGNVLAALEVEGLVAPFPVIGLRSPFYNVGEGAGFAALDLGLAVLLCEFGVPITAQPFRRHIPGAFESKEHYGPWELHEAFAADFLLPLDLAQGHEHYLPRADVRRWCEGQLAAWTRGPASPTSEARA